MEGHNNWHQRSSIAPNMNIKRFNHQQISDLLDRGLCLFCEDLLSSNHKCQNKFLMMVAEEEMNLAFGTTSYDVKGPRKQSNRGVEATDLINGDLSHGIAGQDAMESIQQISSEISGEPNGFDTTSDEYAPLVRDFHQFKLTSKEFTTAAWEALVGALEIADRVGQKCETEHLMERHYWSRIKGLFLVF